MNWIVPGVFVAAYLYLSGKMMKDQLQRITVTNAHLGKPSVSLTETKIPIVLDVYNPNSSIIKFDYFQGFVSRAGIRLGDFAFDGKGQKIELKGRGVTPITFNVRLTTLGVVRSLFNIISNLSNQKPQDTIFTVDGIYSAGGFDIPVKFSYDVKKNAVVKTGVAGIGKPYVKMEFNSSKEMEEHFKKNCGQQMEKNIKLFMKNLKAT
jgi:hypothetical protein